MKLVNLFALILLLSACVGIPGTPPPQDPITLAFITWPSAPPGLWQELISTFEQDNPAIHIEPYYREIPTDWPKQADVALGPGLVWYQEAGNRGWLLDLAPFIESDPEFETEDFYPGILSLFQQKEHTWAIPTNVILSVLVYSPDLFREVGAPLPRPDWTWTDLFEAARRIANSDSGQKRYGFLDWAGVSAEDWIAEQSGGLYRQQGNRMAPDLDRPQVRQAVADYLTLADQITVLSSRPGTLSTKEILDRIARGEVGMAVLPLYAVSGDLDRYPNLALAPLPPGDLAASIALSPGNELAVSAGTAHPQAAWRWVRFLSRQNLGDFSPGTLPARRSVAELSGTWEQMPPQAVEVVQATLENQAGRPHLALAPDIGAVYEALGAALVYIQEEGMDIGTALANAQQEALADIQTRQAQQVAATAEPLRVAPPPGATETTLEFLVPADEQLYRAAAEAFENEHPGWHIQVRAMGTSSPTGCLATGLDADALTAVRTWALLAELTPLAEADPHFSPDEFWPQALAAVTWQGRLYGLPGAVSPLVLAYNPAVLEQAGQTPPTPDWTVEEMLLAAEQITAGGRAFGYLPQSREVPFLLEQQGVSLFSADAPHFADPQVLQAVERLRRLGGEQVSVPVPFSDAVSLIQAGRVGMWFEVFNYWPADTWPDGREVTAIRLRPGTALPLRVTMYGLAAGGPQPQRCWTWIRFLAQQGVTASGEVPALRRLAEKGGTGEAAWAASLAALQQSQAEPIRDTPVEDWATWWFVQALDRAARTGDLETALQEAQDKAEAFTACLGPTGHRDLRRVRDCAAQTDPEHPLAHLTP